MTKYLAIVTLLCFALCLCRAAYPADSDAVALHRYAHFSGGFMVQTGSYALWKAVFNPEDKITAHIFALLTTAIVAASKEANDLSNGGQFSGRDFGYGMLGGAAACGVGVVFDF